MISQRYAIDDERACDLECERVNPKTETKLLHEYVGPVRITLVDLLDIGYWQRAWGSAFITLSNLYIGFVLITLVIFSVTFKVPKALNIHIPLCMVGFQLFMPSAILMLNPLFGPANPMFKLTRLFQHIFLQQLAFLFGIAGCIHVLVSVDVSSIPSNPHIITGYMVIFFMVVTQILGPILYYTGIPIIHYVHAVTGLTAFALSSLCLCFAIVKPSFMTWCKIAFIPEVPYILLVLTTLYTIFIMVSVKCRVRERHKP